MLLRSSLILDTRFLHGHNTILGSIVDCLPVALPMRYFAHRVLPASTLPTNTLSLIFCLYFAENTILYVGFGTKIVIFRRLDPVWNQLWYRIYILYVVFSLYMVAV